MSNPFNPIDYFFGDKPKAKPKKAHTAPTLRTEPTLGERWKDTFVDAASRSLIGAATRKVADWTDYKKPDGVSEEEHDRAIAQAERDRRARYDKKYKDEVLGYRKDKSLGRNIVDVGTSLAANILGGADPTYVIAPGSNAVRRVGAQAGVQGVTDAATQGVEIRQGVRDKYDVGQMATSALLGGVFQGGSEGVGKLAKTVRDRKVADTDSTLSRPLVADEVAPEGVVTPDEQRIVDNGTEDGLTGTVTANTPAPRVSENFENPSFSKSGRLTYEPTIDTPTKTQYYAEFDGGKGPETVQLTIGKEDGAALINAATNKIGDPNAANTQGIKAVREAIVELLETFPEIKTLTGERKTGAKAGGKNETFYLNEAQVALLRQKGFGRKSFGSIGDGQEIIPDGLAHFPQPAKTTRSREATQEAGAALPLDETNFKADGDIGDVSAVAARGGQLVQDTASGLMRALDEHGPGSDEYLEAFTSFLNATERHSKNSAELGRGLNVLRANLSKRETDRITELASNPETAAKFNELLARFANDPEALKKIARDAIKPTLRDHIFSWRYNMMLSGPKTHVYNIFGNSGNIAADIMSKGLAATLDIPKLLTGNQDRVTGRELVARLTGLIQGARHSFPNVKQAYREGRPADELARAEMDRGRVGKWEVPVKMISAEDEFFRTSTNLSAIYGLAVRKAVKEGLTGDGLDDRISQLTELAMLPKRELVAMRLNDKTALDILNEAETYSKKMRFQDDPGFLGQMIESIRTVKKGDTPLTKMGKDGMALLFPFVRTPDSLFRTALRYSPLGVLEGDNLKGFKAGGAERAEAVSRVLIGSSVSASIAAWVLDGNLTGAGPRDYKERERLEMTGWQANSIKVGDRYYSYEGLEPLSHLLTGIATTMERWNEGDGDSYVSLVGQQVFNAAELVKDSTWMETMGDFFDAMTAPGAQREGEINNFFANMGSSFVVPAVVRQFNQTFVDDKMRDTRGDDSLEDRVVNRIKSGVPGLSDDLPVQHDMLGREKRRGETLGPDILSRAVSPYDYDDPVEDELYRLSQANPDAKLAISSLAKTLNTKDFPLGRLNAKDYQDYQMAFGALFSAAMEETMASPEYQEMSDPEREKAIKKIATSARKWAQEDVFVSTKEDVAAEGMEDVTEPEGEEFTFGTPTSMRRTVAGNAAVGGVENSAHLTGEGIDFTPSPGVSWKQLYAEAKRFFGPDAVVIHEGKGTRDEHVHVQMGGLDAPYYGAEGSQ